MCKNESEMNEDEMNQQAGTLDQQVRLHRRKTQGGASEISNTI
jgi:hypothetical protein